MAKDKATAKPKDEEEKKEEKMPVYETKESVSFNIDSSVLLKTLTLIKKHSSKNNVVPITSYTLCKIEDDALSFYFTNLETEIRQVVAISGIKGTLKEFLVDIEDLFNISKVMNVELLSFDISGNTINIQEGFNEYKIPLGPNPNEFPKAAKDKKIASVAMKYNDFFSIMSEAILFAGHEQLRIMLNGIYLELVKEENVLKITSTNGHRLYHNELVVEKIAEDFHCITPPVFVSVLNSIGKKDDTLHISFSKDRLWFAIDNVEVRCMMIDAKYPDYANVIPRSNPCVLQYDRSELSTAIKKINTVSKDSASSVKLNFNADETIISARSIDFGQNIKIRIDSKLTGEMPQQEIPVIEGDPKIIEGNMICLNAKFLKEIIDVYDSKDIYMHGSIYKRAVIVSKTKDLTNYFILLMPVMIN